uniref:RagB/SusD family nutrient uptake outer membrane protein n=1 Tax=uncultured Draconibacterium sp. TaxID=1573823 RepID=UPI003216E305
MNKFIYTAVIALMFFNIGCNEDEFLTQVPEDKLTSESYYRNIDDAEAALATAYAQLGAANRWDVSEVNFVVEHFRSDLCKPGPDSWNYPDWSAISTFTNTDGNSRSTIYWQDAYRGLFHANQVMEKVAEMTDDKIKPEKRQQIIAEAQFLRGFLHFRLLNNWEQIIVREKAPSSEDELSKGLSTREEAWQLIEADFMAAANDLPEMYDDENIGRATKGAAIGYLGKAYLYQGKWAEAEMELKKLAVNGVGNYALVDNYQSLFDGTNENSEEAVFEIQYSAIRSNGRHIGHVLGKFTSPSELGGWGNIEASSKLLDVFKTEGKVASTGKYDSRMYQTIFFNDTDVDVFGYSYGDWFGEDSERVILRKYTLSDRPEYDNDPWYSSQNVPVMRYADVLLMYAEALNENNKSSEAVTFVNQVRARADMPALENSLSQGELREKIKHERAVELAYEGHRFFDLRRWGQSELENAMKSSSKIGAENFSSALHAFFPIPESEKNTNSEL